MGSESQVLLEEPRPRVLMDPWAPPHQSTHREVANSERVLQKALEGHGPAGGPPLTQAPAALHAGEAGIAAQTVVAHAVLQVGASQFCGTSTHLTCTRVRHACPAGPSQPSGEALPDLPSLKPPLSRHHAPSACNMPGAVLGTWNGARIQERGNHSHTPQVHG